MRTHAVISLLSGSQPGMTSAELSALAARNLAAAESWAPSHAAVGAGFADE
jgi:hypothetical protein